MAAATAVQVTCSSTQSGDTIDPVTLEAYFSNGRYTGVQDSSSMEQVELIGDLNDLQVYSVTYANAQGTVCPIFLSITTR